MPAYIAFFAEVTLGLWLYYDIVIKHKFEFKVPFFLTFHSEKYIVKGQNEGTA